ncbi:MAG TPA: hypothetical protein VGB77_18855 [Abditibacteriaceae bacterium]
MKKFLAFGFWAFSFLTFSLSAAHCDEVPLIPDIAPISDAAISRIPAYS